MRYVLAASLIYFSLVADVCCVLYCLCVCIAFQWWGGGLLGVEALLVDYFKVQNNFLCTYVKYIPDLLGSDFSIFYIMTHKDVPYINTFLIQKNLVRKWYFFKGWL